ncbi:MAG: DUF6702 family protein [Chitinophagaceae bacterium]
MAALLNKWLFLSLLPLYLFDRGIFELGGTHFTPGKQIGLHPFHVSVVEMEHNPSDKTLEISCKTFTDDFEVILADTYNAKVDLINPTNKPAMDSLVKKYIISHLSVKVNGQPVKFSYVGFEHEKEAVYGYLEVSNVVSVHKIDVSNSLMYDLFDDQVNIMHISVGGKRISTKLNYPDKIAVFNW